MDLWTAMRTVGRHWLVLLLALAVTGAVISVLAMRVEQRYSATGTVVVISPGGRNNPIDIYSSSSSLAASIASTLGSDDASKAEVQAKGGTSDYTVATDPSLPVMTITTTSANAHTAIRSVGLVSQVMNQLLAQRQTEFGTPRAIQLQVLSVTAPTSAKVTTYKLTVLGIAGALGVLVAISLTFIAESASERRRLRPDPPASQPPLHLPEPWSPYRSWPEPTPSRAEPVVPQESRPQLPGEQPTEPAAPASPSHLGTVPVPRRRLRPK